MSVIEHPIRLLSAGLDGRQPAAYGVTQFPSGMYVLFRLDLAFEGGYAEWTPCSHAWNEEVMRGSIYRWTGLSIPLWLIRGENRTEAS